MKKPLDLPNIRNITISGRIGVGATTLAHALSEALGWKHLEGGEIFWEAVRQKLDLSSKDTDLRPDDEDKRFDQMLKALLSEKSHNVVETKLAGFNGQNIKGVYKILVLCEDERGEDQTAIRIDRLVNREHIPTHDAKEEIFEREEHDIEKWRRLYASGEPDWVYWDRKYYDLLINTYNHNPHEALNIALEAVGYKT